MATILPFIIRSETAFDDEVTHIMGLAFDAACAGLGKEICRNWSAR